jgi:hypothetical protein
MQAGTPVVCSDGAGVHDLIEDGENGFGIPAEDEKSLANAIWQAASLSEKKRREIGRAGKETVQGRMEPRRIAQERLENYREIEERRSSQKEELWLAEAARPTKAFEVESDPLRFLDRLPLSALVKYTGGRLWKKIIKR